MMKKIATMTLATALVFLTGAAYAGDKGFGRGGCEGSRCEGRECRMMGKGEGRGSGCPVTGKLMKKADFILGHQEDLGLTDAQVASIKALKLKAEKDSIQQEAAKEIFMLDLKEKMGEDTIDVAGIGALIDQNTAQMASAAKANVAGYAELKKTLTPDQVNKMKEIWKAKKK